MPKSASASASNKRSGVLNYILSSRTCHTLKDLEKSIPSAVAGISPMQVKDYIQSLLDEDELRVEKIGSGNWYWRFGAADFAKLKADQLRLEAERLELEHETDTVKSELQQIQKEISIDEGEAETRAEVQTWLNAAEKEVETLKKELIGYSDLDPKYLENTQEQVDSNKVIAEKWTEMIHSMTRWLRMNAGVGRETFVEMQKEWYGEEWNEDDGTLKEI